MQHSNELLQQRSLTLSARMAAELRMLAMTAMDLHAHIEELSLCNPFIRFRRPPDLPRQDLAVPVEQTALPETLTDVLLAEIGTMRISGVERAVAHALVYSLDADGYMREPLDVVGQIAGVPPNVVEAVLLRLQREMASGLFARDLAECLRIQLVARDRFDPLIAPLLDHLDMVASGDIAAIMNLCQVDEEDAIEMVSDIRALSPRPPEIGEVSAPAPMIPDLIASLDTKGQLKVTINPDAQPKVLMDDELLAELSKGAPSQALLHYVRKQYRDGAWLVSALARRAATLRDIGQLLEQHQTRYLTTGEMVHRGALTMEQVGAQLKLHKSTISRAVRGRTISTPHGVRLIGDCFMRSVSSNNQGLSADQVADRIKRLVAMERPGQAWSDERLVGLLGQSGIKVARRTIAKYRLNLGIPPAAKRNQTAQRDRFDTDIPT